MDDFLVFYKLELVPNDKQQEILKENVAAYKDALEYIKHCYEEKFNSNGKITYDDFHDVKDSLRRFKNGNDKFKNINEKVFLEANQRLYNKILNLEDSFKLNELLRVEDNCFYLHEIKFYDGAIKLPVSKTIFGELREEGKNSLLIPYKVEYSSIYNPQFSYDYILKKVCYEDSKWYVYLGIKRKMQGIGIDLGIKSLAVCSDQTKYLNINECNMDSYIALIKKITTQIVNKNPEFICIETINIEDLEEYRLRKGYLNNENWEKFKILVKYFSEELEKKTKEKYIKLIKAPANFASTKKCSMCGERNENMTLHERTYKCLKCGTVLDRDFNAALNLQKYGEEETRAI